MNTEHLLLMSQEDDGLSKTINLLKTGGCTALIFTPEETHYVFANMQGEFTFNLFQAVFCNAMLAPDTPLELKRAMLDWCLEKVDEFDQILFEGVIDRLKKKLGGQGNETD